MSQAILVVEDDKHINQVVSEYLKDSGFVVFSVDTGDKALAALSREESIDLFIFDIMLPGCSGLELLQAVRGSARFQNKPVMMLTALSDEYTQLLSFDGLADDYITKPFSPKVLVKRAQALLRRTGGDKQGHLCCGPIMLYPESYEVSENGELLCLTLREFELLHALMKNSNKVLSRQQLLNNAWGYDYFGDERIVDVHIKNLRKKLQSNLISTVKGVGYKLACQPEQGVHGS